jgi:hypothetical protein
MTFEQFATIVRNWAGRLDAGAGPIGRREPPSPIYISDLPDASPLDAVLAAIARGGPAPVPKAVPKPPPRSPATVKSGTGHQGSRGQPSKRAQALVRAQLAAGPKRGEEVQAAAHLADISELSLIAAASALGVRTRKGQWRGLNAVSHRARAHHTYGG